MTKDEARKFWEMKMGRIVRIEPGEGQRLISAGKDESLIGECHENQY